MTLKDKRMQKIIRIKTVQFSKLLHLLQCALSSLGEYGHIQKMVITTLYENILLFPDRQPI